MNSPRPAGRWVRRWWPIGIVVLLIAIGIWLARADAVAAAHQLAHADPIWVVVSIPVLAMWYFAWSSVYVSSRHLVEGGQTWRDVPQLVPTTAASIAINLVAKSAGMAGLASFLVRASRRGESRGKVIGAYLFAAAATEVGFVVMLLATLIAVVLDGGLTVMEVLASIVFLLYAAARVGIIVVAAWSREGLRRLWSLPGKILDRLLRRPPVDRDTETPDELYEAVSEARRRPIAAVPPLLAAVAVDLLAAVMLWIAIAAITGENRPVAALVAYGVSSLFAIVGFLPGGIGFAEVGGAALLVGAGFSTPTAVAIMLLYRIFDFWLPLVLGGLSSFALGRRTVEVSQ